MTHDPKPTSLFAQPFEVQGAIVPVHQIVFPEGDEVNPAIEKPGVLQSVLLARTGLPDTPYRVIDGKRRVRSAMRYGHATVPAIITDGTRGQIAAASAMLNAARNANPLDEARNWKTALEEGQYLTVQDLARDMRVSASTIKKRLALLRLPESLLLHVGVLIADGVAEKMANLDDVYLAEAINAAERKLDLGEKFTAQDLKCSQVKRVDDLQGSLDDLFGTSPLPELFERPDPLEQVVSEVRRLAALHGVELEALVLKLQAPVGLLDLSPVQPQRIEPLQPPVVGEGLDWLETVGAPSDTPAVQAVASTEDSDWLGDLMEVREVPITPPDVTMGRRQLGLR